MNKPRVAVFDTRIDIEKVNSKCPTFMVKHFGYATDTMLKQLKKRGYQDIKEAYFYVDESEGPL